MRKIVLLTALLGLTACIDQPVQPAVSAYNGDSVQIHLSNIGILTPDALAASQKKADVEAAEICRRGHKKRAEFVSKRMATQGSYITDEVRLYLCLR